MRGNDGLFRSWLVFSDLDICQHPNLVLRYQLQTRQPTKHPSSSRALGLMPFFPSSPHTSVFFRAKIVVRERNSMISWLGFASRQPSFCIATVSDYGPRNTVEEFQQSPRGSILLGGSWTADQVCAWGARPSIITLLVRGTNSFLSGLCECRLALFTQHSLQNGKGDPPKQHARLFIDLVPALSRMSVTWPHCLYNGTSLVFRTAGSLHLHHQSRVATRATHSTTAVAAPGERMTRKPLIEQIPGRG